MQASAVDGTSTTFCPKATSVDADPHNVADVRDLAAQLAPKLPVGNFRCQMLDQLTLLEATHQKLWTPIPFCASS